MPNGRLLDTNVIIRVMKDELLLPAWYEEYGSVFVSSITLGELLLGAELSARTESNRRDYIDFCNDLEFLTVDFSVAQAYAKVKATLRKLGTPIPENDMWIAATALAFDLIIVTGDKHFERVTNLQVEYV